MWNTSPDFPSAPSSRISRREPNRSSLTALKKPRHCTKCGLTHKQNFQYCPGCGNAVAAAARDPHLLCNCNTLFGKDDQFCATCGSPRP